MTLVGDLTTLVYVAWTALLALSSAVLLYLVYARSEMVLYADAMKALAAGMLLGIVGTVLETAYWAGAGEGDRLHLVAWLFIFVGGVVFAGSMWLFARDVVTGDRHAAPFEEYPLPEASDETGPSDRDAGGDDVRDG